MGKAFFLSALGVAAALALGTWVLAPPHSAATTLAATPATAPTLAPRESPTPAAGSASPSATAQATPTLSQSPKATQTPTSTPPPPPPPTLTPTPAPPSTPAPAEAAPATLPSGDGKVLYLSFDDGPDPRWTPTILDLLKANGAHATFFMIGQSAQEHPDLVARVRAEGHAVGNHTWSHPSLTKLSATDAQSQVTRTSTLLGGTTCTRPPYGVTNASVSSILTSLGQRSQLWDVDTRDWSRPGATAIVGAVNTGAKEGAVVLMHDGGADRSQTITAVTQLLPALKAAGWRLEAIPGC